MAMQQNQAMKKTGNPDPSVKTPFSGREQVLFWIGSVLLVTFFAFSPALKNGFINWDDNGFVFENVYLARPFSETILSFFGPHYFIGNYIPLTMLTYALEYHAVALKPHLYHM